MRIIDRFNNVKPVISFEIFPPNREKEGELAKIYNTINELAGLKPDYISVTYGAAGKQRGENTIDIASHIKRVEGIEPLAHLTGISATKDDINMILDSLSNNGIGNILAMRGDKPKEAIGFSDFRYAIDLIEYIKEQRGSKFSLAGACHPEGHFVAKSRISDIVYLRDKVRAGLDFLITQLFFDNEIFYRFRDELRSIDVDVPITVGIMPVVNKKSIERIVSLCGASLPPKFRRILDKYEDDPKALEEAGIAYASDQIIDLLSSGVDGIHIYAMNRPDIAKKLLDNISSVVSYLRDSNA